LKYMPVLDFVQGRPKLFFHKGILLVAAVGIAPTTMRLQLIVYLLTLYGQGRVAPAVNQRSTPISHTTSTTSSTTARTLNSRSTIPHLLRVPLAGIEPAPQGLENLRSSAELQRQVTGLSFGLYHRRWRFRKDQHNALPLFSFFKTC
jgi:hypothetical protein